MQKLKLLIPIALFMGACFLACHPDDFSKGVEQKATVAFVGQIMDEDGNGVSGALVKAGDQSVVTDKNGIFRLDAVSLPADHAILAVSSAGFFDFSRAYLVKDKGLQTVKIQLLAKKIAGQVNAVSGGVVSITDGPTLNFPANAIVDENGNAYTGTVQVLAKYLDPKAADLGLFMPGNLTGLNLAGEKQSLSTFGMIGVELESPAGQKLKIAGNSEVEIRMPIDASIVANAATEIPLWHFDLEKAYWIEEGLAQKVGNEYVGKVKHFSFWNYDGYRPVVKVFGNVYLGDANHPLADVEIYVRPENPADGLLCGYGTTDANGYFGGAVSKDIPLKLEVRWNSGSCGSQVIYSASIGTVNSDATLPPIILPAQGLQALNISGRLLDCAGQPLANGYAQMSVGLSNHFVFADVNGNFIYSSIFCDFNNLQNGTVTGYDIANKMESFPVPFVLPPNTFNVGDLSVCNNLSEYVQYSLDGSPEIVMISFLSGLTFGSTVEIVSEDSVQADRNIRIRFHCNGQLGTFAMNGMVVNSLHVSDVSTVNTQLSALGSNPGDWIVGTFSGTFTSFSVDPNGANHTVTGSYRVKRDY